MRPRWTLLGLAVIGLAGCVKGGPPAMDTDPPSLTLTAFNRRGNPVFQSSEGRAPVDACAKFAAFPARFLLSVGDSGGVSTAIIKTFTSRIAPSSVAVGPGAPESSWAIARPDGISDVLTVRLAAPGPGLVRTGLFVEFEASPDGRFTELAINADARDVRGNAGSLYQVDARLSGDAVKCRGE
jgi:hypothetical protein